MDLEEGRWRKIFIFCLGVLAVKAGVWRIKELYDLHFVSPKFSALFVFGDVAPANFSPYGKSFLHIPTDRFFDGLTTFDFLAARLGAPVPPPRFQRGLDFDLSQGADFASAGSGLLDSTSLLLNVSSFGRQVNEFRNVFYTLEGGSGCWAEQLLLDSIIAINIGANDISGNYLANASLREIISSQEFIESLLKAYENYLLKLHELGGRNFFVFGISPVGCSPGMTFSGIKRWTGRCYRAANELYQQFNFGLEKLVHHLNKNLRESTLVYVNTDG